MRAWLEHSFGLDRRSLAIARIGFALVLVYDLIWSMAHKSIYFSDGGVLPREGLRLLQPRDSRFSLVLQASWWPPQELLMVLALALAVALLVGWRTRLATVGSWLLLLWSHQRNPLILVGGDYWLTSNLFWAMFLPWGDRFSWDSRHRDTPDGPVFSVASAGFVLQSLMVWTFAGWVKTGAAWTADGTALSRILQAKPIVCGLADWLLRFPNLLRFATFGALVFERFGLLLLLSPLRRGEMRTLGVVLFATFHCGLYLGIVLGSFGFVGIFSALALLPDWAWRHTPLARLQSPRPEEVVPSQPAPFYPITQFLLALVIANVTYQNIVSLRVDATPVYPSQALGTSLGMPQRWYFFAPNPPYDCHALEFEGTGPDGVVIPLDDQGERRQGDFDFSTAYTSHRARQFCAWVLNQKRYPGLCRDFARFMARRWNSEHPESPLDEVSIYLSSQPLGTSGSLARTRTRLVQFRATPREPTAQRLP